MGRRAFTMIEVLLVIAILGLIASFVFTNLGRELERRSLDESARRLRTLIMMVQARAMQDGLRYRIEFPGTPDPLDPRAKDEVDVPTQTEQPIVTRESDPLERPYEYEGFAWSWLEQEFIQLGTRCVAVLPGQPEFEIRATSPIAGPSIQEGNKSIFVPLTFNPDGTCDWVTFVLTDLPEDVELKPEHVTRILNVMVDGRTGETWIQRALRVKEVEVMLEYRASPIMHQDFIRGDEITEDNILEVHIGRGGGVSTGR